jgi:hypothetical protein
MKSRGESGLCQPEGTHHAVEQVEGAQTDALILVVEARQHQVLVCLHALRVRAQNLRHCQQPQVLHCTGARQIISMGNGKALTARLLLASRVLRVLSQLANTSLCKHKKWLVLCY